MKLLFLEARPGTGQLVREHLTEAGHHLGTCIDERSGGPCRSVADDSDCPLLGPIDLAVVVRQDGTPDTLAEMGGVCAERHRVPVVAIDPTAAGDCDRLVETAVAAGRDRIEAAHAAQVRAALAPSVVDVDVTRSRSSVHVSITTREPLIASARATMADRARAASRAYDPFVNSIDVAVTSPSS